MGVLAILFALQTAATAGVIFFLWRRLRANERETARLRAMLTPDRGRGDRAEEARVLLLRAKSSPAQGVGASTFSGGVVSGGLLAAAAAAPALGFTFGLDRGWIVALGCIVGAAMMIGALAKRWDAAAWAGVITVAIWALLGVALDADLRPVAGALAAAGVSGVIHARLRALPAGGAMALLTAAALLLWSAQYGVVSVYGAALAVLVVAAAIGGAHLKAETLHLGAFVAALSSLFVLSGQNVAAVWFTPIAAWVGALFFAIAAVRVPAAGGRAATLAGTGLLAPLLAAGMLHRANHALAAPWAAGLAFLLIAACASILLAATLRRHGPARLGLTHWLLGLGAFTAYAIGIGHALSDAIATTALAGLAAALIAVDERWPMALWRCLGSLAALFAVGHGAETVRSTLAELAPFSPLFSVLAGPAAATAILVFAVGLASRSKTPKAMTASTLEAAAYILGMIGAHALLRLVFSDGAPVLKPISFLEACAHVSVWLIAALLIGARWDHPARTATALTIGLAATVATVTMAALWFTPYWTERAATVAIHPAAGFLFLSACYWSHWALWRGRAEDAPTRASLAAAALALAGGAILWLISDAFIADWMKALLSGLALASAIALNFAPGVVTGAYEMRRFRRSSMAR